MTRTQPMALIENVPLNILKIAWDVPRNACL